MGGRKKQKELKLKQQQHAVSGIRGCGSNKRAKHLEKQHRAQVGGPCVTAAGGSQVSGMA